VSLLNFLSTSVVRFFVMLYIIFFLLIDGNKLIAKMKKAIPLKKQYHHKIQKTLEDTTHAIVFGTVVTALIQGGIAGIGYWIIGGFDNAILLGLLTAFFAIIPYLGSAIVWLPASAFVFLSGILTGSPLLLTRGVGLFLFGALVVSTIDNLIKPHIIGGRANIHPVIILIGILGGLRFGLVGVVMGPLILALFIRLTELFEKETKTVR